MLRLDRIIKPWKEAASLNDNINLYGFWNETAFLTKSGDVGMVLGVPGVDYESLDSGSQEYAVKRLEAALKSFGPGFRVYQYLFKSNRPEIPFESYDDPVVQTEVTEWEPVAADKARKEVNKRRRHFNISKTGFISQLGSDPAKTNPRDVLVDESKQSDIENLGDCLRALGDGQSLGEFSLTIVLYSRDSRELERLIGEFTAVFTNADGALFVETYNQLNAYFATVPGNSVLNLRRLLLLNTNYADLSFLFTILPGDRRNQHLGAEYLAVMETDNCTPYFLNLHNGEVAHTLILGMTGSGKSYLCCFLLQNAQKYRPTTFIFDIGGSFQSLTTIFGGSYLNVGRESRDFTINPFSLPRTEENLQFLFAFFRTLVEGNEERYRLDFKEERRLWDGIERMYMLEAEQRTLSNFANIVGELKDRLHRWTRQGQYGFLFDNAEDTLSFSRFKELEESGMLQIVSESCPTKIFLANPEMDRDLYREAFHLNDTELDLIAGLVPPGQMLNRKAQSSKKVHLNVDSVSHWMAVNSARENLTKREYFAQSGIPEGLRRLAKDYPFRPLTKVGAISSHRHGVIA